ncbi:MAG: hypothetical protein ACAI38_11345 [Myxococcota bacterium]
MSHGGKFTMLEAMGSPRFDARLGDAVAASPAVSPAVVRETLKQVETARDEMATEIVAYSAALADAAALRSEAIVLGPLAWARGRVHLSSTLDENVGARETELRVTRDAHTSLTQSYQRLRDRLKEP